MGKIRGVSIPPNFLLMLTIIRRIIMWKKDDFINNFMDINDRGYAYVWLFEVLRPLIKDGDISDAKQILEWVEEVEKENK